MNISCKEKIISIPNIEAPTFDPRYLAAGEVLRSSLDGTAWMMQTVFFMLAGLINCLLMLRTTFFSKATAWLGIVNSAIGLGFFLPTIGLLFLFLNTIGSAPWCLLLARNLLRLIKGNLAQ